MPAKILIVDDMPDAIDFLPEWLQREGYATTMVTRGQQALALAEEMHPDAILLDVMMPGMDGIETCRRLRLNPATASIPIILLSARSPSDARAEGLMAGATDYVTKPIHFPDLLERLERVVHQGNASFDHRRLLEEMAYTALTVLPCNLVWLLIVDPENRDLEHQSLVMEQGTEASQQFLELMHETRFPLVRGDNPLSELILERSVLINIPVSQFRDLPGGSPFYRAFSQFELAYVSLLPLILSEQVIGMMVLATMDTQTVETGRVQQILNTLSTQAAMVVNNARLLADLAQHEEQMRAEQAFRKMVLDTMGEGLIVVDETATITYANNRLLMMTGYTREMLYGRSVGMVFHPDHREKVVSSLIGRNRNTLAFSQQLFTRKNTVVPVLLSRVIAPSPDGTEQNTVMVLTDLSEVQRQEEALKRQTMRLQAINRASDAISSSKSFQEVVMMSLEAALDVVQGISASLLLSDENQPDVLITVGSVGPQTRQGLVALSDGLAGWVARNAKSQIVTDVAQNPQIQEQYTAIYGPQVHSLMAVPLIASDAVIGILEVINKKDGIFDDLDRETLESLTGSAAIAIENIRLLEQMRRRLTELTTLLDASAAASSTLDLGDIIERIARRLSLALQVERVVITSANKLTGRLETLAEVVNAYWAPGFGPVRKIELLPITQAIFETGKIVNDNPEIKHPVEFSPSGLYTIAGFPLKIDDMVLAVIRLQSEQRASALSQNQVDAVESVITHWLDTVRLTDVANWLSRSNLTDLCQRVLQASGLRWCSLVYWDHRDVRLLREIGRAIWLQQPTKTWEIARYPSFERVLNAGGALGFQSFELDDDPDLQFYLQSLGGSTLLVAPLVIRGEAMGLVTLIDSNREGRVFDQAEVSLAQGIANVVGNALENAQLYAVQEQRASALEAAYGELQESDRTKDELLQNLSHELRTPLTHILGYLRLLVDGAFGPVTPEQDEAMQLVVNKAQHLADLVKDIMAVQESTIENLELKPIYLERVVALAVRSMAAKAQECGIRVQLHIPASLPLVYADPIKVGEVFEELLENAIKFSPNSSQIEIRIDDPGTMMLHASVSDQGIGIHPDEHEKIFRRFYQVDRGAARRYGGTGLGLALVRQVIEGHNGRVWVDSELDKGSCFHFTLPKVRSITSED
ncbi:MAG TPA: GAF domain-containing protein [Aggregatilineaceae bacterium]|nr:GAF domain-containing protein [Aggregatilineaceae bacterium]